MLDHKTWSWVKIIVGAIVFWWAWQATSQYGNLAWAVALLGAFKVIGGLLHTSGVVKHK